jgi:hypothetical protein
VATETEYGRVDENEPGGKCDRYCQKVVRDGELLSRGIVTCYTRGRTMNKRLPDVVVLNLHPQNVGETRAMRLAAAELVSAGFHHWTMRECLAWYSPRDGAVAALPKRPLPRHPWPWWRVT